MQFSHLSSTIAGLEQFHNVYSQNLYFEACFELISVELRLNLVELRLSHVIFLFHSLLIYIG